MSSLSKYIHIHFIFTHPSSDKRIKAIVYSNFNLDACLLYYITRSQLTYLLNLL